MNRYLNELLDYNFLYTTCPKDFLLYTAFFGFDYRLPKYWKTTITNSRFCSFYNDIKTKLKKDLKND